MNLLDLPHGIHEGVPADVYHQRVLGVVNNGALKVLSNKTPAHYRAWLEESEDEESDALTFGRALHCAMLEPCLFDVTYVKPVTHPHRRPTAAQRNAKKPSEATLAAITYWDTWNRDNAGLIEITEKEKATIQGMAASVMAHPLAGKLMRSQDLVTESTAIWTDPNTNLLCKARMDIRVPSRRIWADLKSTDDASPEGFAKSIARYGYHVQHGHYSSASAALGEELSAFLFIAVEKSPPYAVAVYVIDTEAESRGLQIRSQAMDVLSECLVNDYWPSYRPIIHRVSLPTWALRD